jgi:hypothetical protein
VKCQKKLQINVQGVPMTEDAEYLPISVSEATTVFEISNVLLKVEKSNSIEKADVFDAGIFRKLESVELQLNEPDRVFLITTAENALKTDAIVRDKEPIRTKFWRKSKLLHIVKSMLQKP